MLSSAKRPIILAGNGAIRKRASEQLRIFAEKTGIGVAKDLDRALELYRLALSYEPEQWVQNSTKGAIRRLEAAKGKEPAQ